MKRPLNFLEIFFPKLSKAKVKEGIFNDPDIRKIMKNEAFTATLNPLQKRG